jgi:hypothetical protein
MDQERFAAWTRHVAQASNRREALRRAAAGALLGVAPGLAVRVAGAQDVTPDSRIIPGCRLPGQRCRKNSNCCTNRCRGHQKRCGCIRKHGSCLVELGGGLPPIPVHANCCSNKCSKQDHKCK